MPFNQDERDQMLENYAKTQEGFTPVDETDASAETEDADASAETEETAETLAEETEETETSDDAEETEESSEAEDGDEEVTEDDKMVPYGALHEEREKRKGLSKKVQELETQLNTVLQDYRAVVDKPDETTDELADPEIMSLKREIAELKQFRTEIMQKDQQSAAKEQQTKLESDVESTDQRLEKDGFPGFIFATDAVAKEIQRLVADDPENAYLYSPEGWEKVYKETVFPKMKGKFSEIHKSELFKKKEELKSKQTLVGKTGKKTAPKKSDKDWNYSDYMKFRRESSFL